MDPAVLLFLMPKSSASAARLQRFQKLAQSLARTAWISEGYVQDRGPGAGGPHYQWTRKVKGKTISLALSAEQYHWLKTAIANWRHLQHALKEMRRLSREELFSTIPDLPRRKRLSKSVLGTN
jgi:hypothetical protein